MFQGLPGARTAQEVRYLLSHAQLFTRANYPETPALQLFSWQPQSLVPQQGVPPFSLYSSREQSVSSFDTDLNSDASRLKQFSCFLLVWRTDPTASNSGKYCMDISATRAEYTDLSKKLQQLFKKLSIIRRNISVIN